MYSIPNTCAIIDKTKTIILNNNAKLSKHIIKFELRISIEKNQRPRSKNIKDPEFKLK